MWMAFQVDLRPKQSRGLGPSNCKVTTAQATAAWSTAQWSTCNVELLDGGSRWLLCCWFWVAVMMVNNCQWGVVLPKANVSLNSSYFSSFGCWAVFGMKLQLVEWQSDKSKNINWVWTWGLNLGREKWVLGRNKSLARFPELLFEVTTVTINCQLTVLENVTKDGQRREEVEEFLYF